MAPTGLNLDTSRRLFGPHRAWLTAFSQLYCSDRRVGLVKVLVTGGAGFIGGNLCRRLAGSPHIAEVVALDNLSTGRAENLSGSGARFVEADLLDLQAVRAAAAGCASIVHLGARPSVPKSIQDPLASHHANATGTMNLLEAARLEGVGHVVVASSSSVYGANPTLPKSENLKPSPLSPYAASKLATEAYALAYGTSFDMKVLAFRFFNVFGPLQAAGHSYAAVVPAFLDAAIAGRPLTVYGDGKQTRDFTFVGSVCEVIAEAVTGQANNPEPVNLAFGSRVTLLALIELLESLVGQRLEREHLGPRVGDVRHSQADQTTLRSMFPNIEPVSITDGLTQTLEWFRGGCGPLLGQ